MRTMVNFTISTNIIRDVNHDIQYISTPNSHNVFKRIASGFQTGLHSFNIIGSYGTGKSSFLWALEKNLGHQQPVFEPLNGQFKGIKNFLFFKIVGEADSFIEIFNEKLGLPPHSSVKKLFVKLQELYDNYYNTLEQPGLLVIVVDEFGKFLEHASRNNPEKELYFLQQLAEFVNDPVKNIVLITTLHQNFGAYARGLSKDQKQEWEKVKGRFIDIAFDEPIEQLLFLASKRIQNFGFEIPSQADYDSLFALINQSKLISNSTNLNKELADHLYPFDYLSANLLAQALQKYGQNERSLFTFLASKSEKSIQTFQPQHNETYSVAHVFDYLVTYLSSELEDRDSNPHKATWQAIFTALEKAEALNQESFEEVAKLIKCIGLVNIFGKPLGLLNGDTLGTYAQLAMGIDNAPDLLEKLVRQRIIKYFGPRNKFFFLEGTDVDFDKELSEAEGKVELLEDVSGGVKYYCEFPVLTAKRIQYEVGTPRLFAFNILSFEDLETNGVKPPKCEIDGQINLVFTQRRVQKRLQDLSSQAQLSQVFVLYKDVELIRQTLFEISKIDFVIAKYPDDQAAQKILLEDRQHQVTLLRNLIFDDLFSGKGVFWIYHGEVKSIQSYRDMNAFISQVASKAYSAVPVYRNEMVNKEQLSSPILTARKALLSDMLHHADQEDLGYPKKIFPPQKTIYLSLLKDTGIHRKIEDSWILGAPTDSSFEELWQASEDFLKQAQTYKRPVNELYELLAEAPFKLKKGFVDFWIPIYLIIKKEDYALFHLEQGYIPYLSAEVLDLLYKNPKNYLVKAYQVEGLKLNLYQSYRDWANVSDAKLGKESSFISIFSQFIRFYNGLPAYTKKTTRLTKSTLSFREAIDKARDPADALFEEFPKALGFHNLNLKEDSGVINSFVEQLNASIYELRTAYTHLLDRVEEKLLKVLRIEKGEFNDYQDLIQRRFHSIQQDLLLPKQKTFYKRLMSPLDERDSWIKSICDVLLGKNLHEMKDEEEGFLMLQLDGTLHDLEKLIDLHALKQERQSDEIFRFEVLSHSGSMQKETIIVSSELMQDIDILIDRLSVVLGESKEVNKAALLRLLTQ